MSRSIDPRTSEAREREPMMPILPFVESATRGHCGERYEGEDHDRWLVSLQRREQDPVESDPDRPSIPPELSVADSYGPDLE